MRLLREIRPLSALINIEDLSIHSDDSADENQNQDVLRAGDYSSPYTPGKEEDEEDNTSVVKHVRQVPDLKMYIACVVFKSRRSKFEPVITSNTDWQRHSVTKRIA